MNNTQTETKNAREFREGLEEIRQWPDGPRRLRFIFAIMTGPEPVPPMTPDEVWRRYREFCEQEAS